MAVVPNRIVDGHDMLQAMGEVLEGDEEEDPLSEEIKKRMADGKGWSAEERQKYLDSLHDGPELPMFADSFEDMDPRLVEALSALKYEDETPFDLAELGKENGNKNYKRALKIKKNKKMYFREALKHYTEGCLHILMARKEEDSEEFRTLHANLLANRAACNLYLKNYGTVKRDCTDALKYTPQNMKALYRKAKACVALKQYSDALDPISKGLALDAESKELETLRVQAEEGVVQQKRREDEIRRAEQRKDEALATLWNACTVRGARIGPSLAASSGSQLPTRDKLPTLDDINDGTTTNGLISWPVMLFYPQYSQSDFIEEWRESDMLLDHLAQVFPEEEGPPPVWDHYNEYRCSQLDVYFQAAAVAPFATANEFVNWGRLKRAARGEVAALGAQVAQKRLASLEESLAVHDLDQVWVKVHLGCTLADVLASPHHVASDGIPNFHVYPRASAAHHDFKEKQKGKMEQLIPSLAGSS